MFNSLGNSSSNSGGGASAGSGGFDFIEEARKKQQLKAMMEVPKTPTTPKPKALDLGAASLSSGQPKSLSTPSAPTLTQTQGGSTPDLNPPQLRSNPNVMNPSDFMAQARRKRRLKVDPASTLRQGGAPAAPRLQRDSGLMADAQRSIAQPVRRPVTEQSTGMPKSKADQEFDAFMAATFEGIAPEEEVVSSTGGYDAGPMAETQGGVPERAYDPSRSAADNRVDALVDRLDRELGPGSEQEAASSSLEQDRLLGGTGSDHLQGQARLVGGDGVDKLSRLRSVIQQVRAQGDNQSRFRETFYDAQARSLPPEERGPALFQRDMTRVIRENPRIVDPVEIRPPPMVIVPPPLQREDMWGGPVEDPRVTGEATPNEFPLNPADIAHDVDVGTQNPSASKQSTTGGGRSSHHPGDQGKTGIPKRKWKNHQRQTDFRSTIDGREECKRPVISATPL